MWFAMQGDNPTIDVKDGDLSIPQMVANKHTLFLNKRFKLVTTSPMTMENTQW